MVETKAMTESQHLGYDVIEQMETLLAIKKRQFIEACCIEAGWLPNECQFIPSQRVFARQVPDKDATAGQSQ